MTNCEKCGKPIPKPEKLCGICKELLLKGLMETDSDEVWFVSDFNETKRVVNLLPCPFCGTTDPCNSNERGECWFVSCPKCIARGPRVFEAADISAERLAAERWNKRVFTEDE